MTIWYKPDQAGFESFAIISWRRGSDDESEPRFHFWVRCGVPLDADARPGHSAGRSLSADGVPPAAMDAA
jgi:hypothetical protein